MKGKLLPKLEDELKKKKHGFIYPKVHMAKGAIGDETFTISSGFDCSVFVNYKGRTVRFKAEDIVKEAVQIIDKEVNKK